MPDNTYLILFTDCNPLALHAAFDAIAGERNTEEKRRKQNVINGGLCCDSTHTICTRH